MSSFATNSAGLSPEESRALPERAAQPHEEKILTAIKEMYSCKPKETTFDIYVDKAVFHDPVGIAEGVASIRAQFVGLAKIFERADIPKFRVLENPSSVPKSTILVDQDVSYYRSAKADSPTKTMNSLLTIETDDSHRVTAHYENWNHERTSTSEDGFLGMLNEQRKRVTAALTDAVIGKK
ncbi:hypothetical protein BD626DRAFT_397610 [Schizophyllum amplum]|uniref:SnoaL-like domain-containing protein n=1 Tax=Schizophyllum amplum TaxID=97359 RepID=A0A550CNF2_9AGAR|nr:hypothetical protein BD626DRAFT_397610 [Auriculariopsis ampla]